MLRHSLHESVAQIDVFLSRIGVLAKMKKLHSARYRHSSAFNVSLRSLTFINTIYICVFFFAPRLRFVLCAIVQIPTRAMFAWRVAWLGHLIWHRANICFSLLLIPSYSLNHRSNAYLMVIVGWFMWHLILLISLAFCRICFILLCPKLSVRQRSSFWRRRNFMQIFSLSSSH